MGRRPGWGHPATGERDYSDEEREFLAAVDRERRRLGRPPTCCEILEVAKLLGYRKVEPKKG
jgi:hypothetical protein